MSFLDDIIGLGKTAYSFLKKDTIGSTIAKTALTGFALSQMTKSMNKGNETKEDKRGTIVTVDPNTDYSIPVVYGKAKLQGTVTDAALSTDRSTMSYVITLCEKTGTLLSTSQDSVIKFSELYWNKQRIQFKPDGVTVDKLVAEDGFEDTSVRSKIKIYCFNNGSTHQVAPVGSTLAASQAAWQVMQDWTVNHTMNNLVFAVVKITYDSTSNLTGLADMEFILENSLTLPGDVLNDYMTNTRYGAGIAANEIYTS